MTFNLTGITFVLQIRFGWRSSIPAVRAAAFHEDEHRNIQTDQHFNYCTNSKDNLFKKIKSCHYPLTYGFVKVKHLWCWTALTKNITIQYLIICD